MNKRVYVASSWRNPHQPALVARLLEEGHEVYDFREHTDPRAPRPYVFAWTEVDPGWQDWTNAQYLRGLEHPAALAGFACDMEGLRWAEVCVLLLPCGRSAHLEAGWAAGAGKEVHVLLAAEECVPELMYRMCAALHADVESLVDALDCEHPFLDDMARCTHCLAHLPERTA